MKRNVVLDTAICTDVSKAGNEYKYLEVMIPIPGQEPVQKRLFLEPIEIAMLEIAADD